MGEKLEIFEGIHFDEVITKEEYHTYYPRTNNFNLNDEIRISIQNQDVYTLPSESYIYIEGSFKSNAAGTGKPELTNNAYAFLFDQVRYEISGVEIDRSIKPGISSTMKALVSYNENESRMLSIAGWCPLQRAQHTLSGEKFSTCIPLKFLLGFCEDYRKIIANVSQELVLIRSKTDENCYQNSEANGTKKASIEIERVEWHVPHINVNDETRLKLLNGLNTSKPIYIAFRTWQLYELPGLRTTKTDIWPIKTSTNLEKPRYAIIGFQRQKKDNFLQDASTFDHSSITNIKLHLNTESYPYNNMNLDMTKKKYTSAYFMYTKFQPSYYRRLSEPLLNYQQFQDSALFVIDCSKQSETVKSGAIDVKLEMECQTAFDDSTAALCLLLHDRIFEYNALTGIVKKII